MYIFLCVICVVGIVLPLLHLMGKKDMGMEYYPNLFVAYVLRRNTYTANIHDKTGKLIYKLRNTNYVKLQADVKAWIDEKQNDN